VHSFRKVHFKVISEIDVLRSQEIRLQRRYRFQNEQGIAIAKRGMQAAESVAQQGLQPGCNSQQREEASPRPDQ